MVRRSVAFAAAGIVAFAAIVGPSVAAAEKPRRPFRLELSLETRYDDNILQLSDEDKNEFREDPDPEKFLIESIDDYVAIGKVDLRWKGKAIRKRETAVRASVDAFRYLRNDVKDHEKLGLSVSQEITASRRHLASVKVGFSRTPDFYKRQRVDEDASFDAGRKIVNRYDYDENRYALAYDQEIVDGRLESRLGWKYFDRDYNDHFNERDSTKDIWSLAVTGRPFRDAPFECGLAHEAGELRARGDLPSSPITDDDVSYRQRAFELEAEYRWKGKRRGRVGVRARRELRDFETTNIFDLGHSGRRDERSDYRATLIQRISRELDLTVELRRKSNDVTFPSDFAESDDVTDFVENRFTVGLAWAMDF